MQQDRTAKAFALISAMMEWEGDRTLDWDMGPATLSTDDGGDVVWSVTPKVGGPVRISHRTYCLENAGIDELAEIASQLVSIGKEAELHSHERAGFEADLRRAARSLLRRKAAAGIRLIDVVTQTIPTDYYQYIGLDVTFEWGPAGAERRATFEVGSESDLREQFEDLCGELAEAPWRWAA